MNVKKTFVFMFKIIIYLISIYTGILFLYITNFHF